MCSIRALAGSGGTLYFLGLLISGVMFIVIGSEYNKDDTDQSHLKTFFWVYAIAMLIGTIGLVLEKGPKFCGDDEVKGFYYFAGLFQVVSGFAWAGFGAGIAHFYESQYDRDTDAIAADERGNLAWLSGAAALFYAMGSFFDLKKLLCCEGFSCDANFVVSVFEIALMIMLVVSWFLFADKLGDLEGLGEGDGDKDRRTFSYLLGVFYILLAFGGVGKCLGICFGGNDDPEPIDDGYGNQDSYGNDDQPTTTGYGEQQRGSYGDQPQGY